MVVCVVIFPRALNTASLDLRGMTAKYSVLKIMIKSKKLRSSFLINLRPTKNAGTSKISDRYLINNILGYC